MKVPLRCTCSVYLRPIYDALVWGVWSYIGTTQALGWQENGPISPLPNISTFLNMKTE